MKSTYFFAFWLLTLSLPCLAENERSKEPSGRPAGSPELQEFEAWAATQSGSGTEDILRRYLSRMAAARVDAQQHRIREDSTLSRDGYVEWLKRRLEGLISVERFRSKSVDPFRAEKSPKFMESPGLSKIWERSISVITVLGLTILFSGAIESLSSKQLLGGIFGTVSFAAIADGILNRLEDRFKSRWEHEVKVEYTREFSKLVQGIESEIMRLLVEFLHEVPHDLDSSEAGSASDYSRQADRISALLLVIDLMKKDISDRVDAAYEVAKKRVRGRFPISKSRQLKALRAELNEIRRGTLALINLSVVAVLQEGYAKVSSGGDLLSAAGIQPVDLEVLFQVPEPRHGAISCASILPRLTRRPPSAS